jgi:hypothetical protein
VTFALSYLQGTALEYFEPSILDSSDISVWSHDWSAFIRTLQTHFGPIDPTADAEDDIDNLKMSENHHIVKYNVKFNQLAIQTGWDNSILRHCYYSGLAERIKDIMGQQRKPPTLSAMRNLAHSIDSHYWDRLCEKSHSEISVLRFVNSASYSENSAPPSSSKHHPASSVPSTVSDKLGKDGNLTFHERQCCFDNNLCLWCGKAGHMVKECPKSLARARAAQAKEFSEAEDSNSKNSENSNNSDHDNSDSGNYDSEDSESHGNSDPEDPNYDNLYSDNFDPEDSDSNNSGSDKINSENPVSDNSDSEDSNPGNSNPGNSGSEHSEPRDPASDNPESDDSGSEIPSKHQTPTSVQTIALYLWRFP